MKKFSPYITLRRKPHTDGRDGRGPVPASTSKPEHV